MSGLRKAFHTDKSKEEDGFELELIEAPNDDKSIPTFILARMTRTNTEYTKAMEEAYRPHRRRQQLGMMTMKEHEQITLDIFCQTILRGWKNVQDDKGQDIKFSFQAAKDLLSELPDLYDRLLNEANEVANFKTGVQEAEAKN